MECSDEDFYNSENLELLKTQPAVRQRGCDLHKAISNGDHSNIRRLLSQKDGVPLEMRNNYGLTALQVLCAKKEGEMVATLLKAGCNVNARSAWHGKTALAVSAFAGDLNIFELLINQGASLDITDSRGWSILHMAVLGGSTDIVEYILKLRPKMRLHEDNNGRTPLHLAAFADITNRRLLDALLPNTNVAPILNQRQIEMMVDVNGRSALDMASLHHSSLQDWKTILNFTES